MTYATAARKIGIGAIFAATLGTTHTAQADDGFDGLYRPAGPGFSNWTCNTIGLDGGAFSIQGQQLVMVERWCELNAATPVREMDAILYDATCFSEGDRSTERLMLMRRAEGGVYLVRNGTVVAWDVCVPPA